MLIKRLDEPITNYNFFNSFFQSKIAKENNCKVILTGDGADEILEDMNDIKNVI